MSNKKTNEPEDITAIKKYTRGEITSEELSKVLDKKRTTTEKTKFVWKEKSKKSIKDRMKQITGKR